MAIRTEESTDGRVVTIRITGQFNINLLEEFSVAYKGYLGPVEMFIIDLGDTDYMDSSALGMLLLIRERAGGEQANIEIRNCSATVLEIFTVANFQKLLTVV